MNVLPHSIEAEKALIGGILTENSELYSVLDLLTPADFYQYSHEMIYRALVGLITAEMPADLVTLRDWMARKGTLEQAGGISYIAGIMDCHHTGRNVKHYGKIIRNHARRRLLMKAAITIGETDMDLESMLSTLQDAIELSTQNSGIEGLNARQLAVEQADHYDRIRKEGGIIGMATGIDCLDNLLRGLQHEEYTTVAGRPGTGKTALLTTLIRNMPQYKIAMWSLEQGRQMILHRIACGMTGIDLVRLRDGLLTDNEWTRIHSAMGTLSAREEGLWICDTPGVTLDQIITETRRRKEKHGLDIVMIDYFTLIRHNIDRKQVQTHEIYKDASRRLKEMARKLKIHLIILGQVKGDLSQYQEPDIFSLGETRQLAYDADNEIYLYQREGKIMGQDEDFIKVGKQRNGPTAKFSVWFNRSATVFENVELRDAKTN